MEEETKCCDNGRQGDSYERQGDSPEHKDPSREELLKELLGDPDENQDWEEWEESTLDANEAKKLIEAQLENCGKATARGHCFRINGYFPTGVHIDYKSTTVEFIRDHEFRGVLFGKNIALAPGRIIKIYDKFTDDFESWQKHLWVNSHSHLTGDKVAEYIGYHRTPENVQLVDRLDAREDEYDDQKDQAYNQPCTNLVLTFQHNVFEEYVYRTKGIIIDEVLE